MTCKLGGLDNTRFLCLIKKKEVVSMRLLKFPIALVVLTMILLLTGGNESRAVNLIVNGDFETGDLSGWTINNFDSSLQQGVIPYPADALTAGLPYNGGIYAYKIRPGNQAPDAGIRQSVSVLSGGLYTFNLDLAYQDGFGGGGSVDLYLDGNLVATQNWSSSSNPQYGHLSGAYTTTDNNLDVFINFKRNFHSFTGNPRAFLDNVSLDGPPPPAPNTPPTANAGPDQTVLVGESVMFDGSASSDPDGTIQSYDWSFGDNTPSQTGVTVTHVYSAAGQYTSTLTVTDNNGATGSDTLIVTVQTPQQAAQTLIDSITNLISSNVLNNGQGNALISKLEAAIQKLDQGNSNAAENQLNAFINQVNAMVNSGTLTTAQGQLLIDAANDIINNI